MTFQPDRFAAIATERRLKLGHPIVFRAITGSTNDDALDAAREGAPHGALFVAETQTNGRGRRGNRWFGAAGESALFTVLLRPNAAVERVSGLALVGGLAVRAAAELWLRAAGQNEPVLVKWPNDVILGGRKLCGILAESQVRSAEIAAVALGIGLNVGPGALPEDVSGTATSLAAWGIENPSMEALVADVLTELEPRIERFLAGGDGTVAELRSYDSLLGRRVKVGNVEGIGAGINRSGSLLLTNGNGSQEEVVAGHVELLP